MNALTCLAYRRQMWSRGHLASELGIRPRGVFKGVWINTAGSEDIWRQSCVVNVAAEVAFWPLKCSTIVGTLTSSAYTSNTFKSLLLNSFLEKYLKWFILLLLNPDCKPVNGEYNSVLKAFPHICKNKGKIKNCWYMYLNQEWKNKKSGESFSEELILP